MRRSMNKGFWGTLTKPFLVLAPLADVTDPAFRRVIAKYGKPDVTWTEFVSADGLAFAPEVGRKKLLADLIYKEEERPIIAQFFTGNPESMRKAAELANEMGFDGIDINMGCPDRAVIKNGCCSALIENRERARDIIEATIAGSGGLPVSVKTRTGLNSVVTEDWINFLLQFDLAAITLHARTAKQMSKGSADWSQIRLAVELRNKKKKDVVIIGNGDVQSREDGLRKSAETGCDGIMIGRGIFRDIWVFKSCHSEQSEESLTNVNNEVPKVKSEISHYVRNDKNGSQHNINERIKILLRHLELHEKEWGDNSKGVKKFDILKKFFKIYISDFEGAGELRAKLMTAKTLDEVRLIIATF